ncbi:MAG: flavin reductase family protein [Clostridia bacterium]|nr:flavin reductase family protein [Clostridia bacterium]
MKENTYRAIGATTFLSPVPAVVVSCRGTQEGFDADNLITIAWAGVVNSDPPMLSVSVRPERHSYPQIVQSGEFIVNLIDKPLCKAADFCGVKSGRDVDKFAALGLDKRYVEGFSCAAIASAPAFACCKVEQQIHLGTHDMFIGRVHQVYVREDLFDEDGSLHLERAGLIAYAHGQYFPLRERPEGFFGYSVAREEVIRRRLIEPYKKPAPKKTPGKGRKA